MRTWTVQLGGCLALWMAAMALPAGAQSTAAQAAAAGGGSSNSANGGTGGVGLGGVGPGVPGSAGSLDTARPPGNGALVGPRAERQSRELMAEHPERGASAPRNTGQRALMLDQSRRPATATPATKN